MMNYREVIQSQAGKKALHKTLLLLGKRSYTVKQIAQKLKQAGYSEEVIEAVTSYCLDMGYLNDQEYIEQWVSSHNRIKPIGRRRIIHELRLKGIEPGLVTAYLANSFSDEQECELATSLIKKKIGHNLEIDDKVFRKLYQFLLRRGFSHNIALKVLSNYYQERIE